MDCKFGTISSIPIIQRFDAIWEVFIYLEPLANWILRFRCLAFISIFSGAAIAMLQRKKNGQIVGHSCQLSVVRRWVDLELFGTLNI